MVWSNSAKIYELKFVTCTKFGSPSISRYLNLYQKMFVTVMILKNVNFFVSHQLFVLNIPSKEIKRELFNLIQKVGGKQSNCHSSFYHHYHHYHFNIYYYKVKITFFVNFLKLKWNEIKERDFFDLGWENWEN